MTKEPTILWEGVKALCPNETQAIIVLLKEYDISLSDYMDGVVGNQEWDAVVCLPDYDLDISEMDEAKLQDEVIAQLRLCWSKLTAAFEQATTVEGNGLQISKDIVFGEPCPFDKPFYFGNYSGMGRGHGTLPTKTCWSAVRTCLPCLRKVLM